jgi:8-oxo-dGTP pyrophosphatase MutT (NUDIX family)
MRREQMRRHVFLQFPPENFSMAKKKGDSTAPAPIAQACAVPFRQQDGQTEFCLITSAKRGRWIFPKGIIDPGETYVETALKEAHEEAGLHGKIVGEPIGNYETAKWGTTLDVTVVLMEVSEVDDDWLEANIRKRQWASASKTAKLLDDDDMRTLFGSALRELDSIKCAS